LRIVRFKVGGTTRYGALAGSSIIEYTGTPFTIFRRGRRRYPLKHVVLLARAKAFDTFCPIGPCIATDVDPNALTIEAYVNGELQQSSNTKDMIFPIEDIGARVSQVMTLLPGDVIATGTPAGIGPLQAGDRVEVRIESIGSLQNPVVRL